MGLQTCSLQIVPRKQNQRSFLPQRCLEICETLQKCSKRLRSTFVIYLPKEVPRLQTNVFIGPQELSVIYAGAIGSLSSELCAHFTNYAWFLMVLNFLMQDLLQEAVGNSLEERSRELQAANQLSEYIRCQESRSMSRAAAQWSPKRRRVGLSGVRLLCGGEVSDPARDGRLLCDCWAGVFSEKPIDMHAA